MDRHPDDWDDCYTLVELASCLIIRVWREVRIFWGSVKHDIDSKQFRWR